MKIDLKSKPSSSAAAFLDMMGGGKAAGGITELPIESLVPYPDQPFRQYTPEKLRELADDIKENGILSPVLVRPHEGGYQILSGHNRTMAAKLAGLPTVPCIVRELDDDAAKLVLVNANLQQRDRLAPSEKAFAYKMQLEAIKHQGKRNDLGKNTSGTMCQKSEAATSGTLCLKSDAREVVAAQAGESSRNIQNYIRLTNLIHPILEMVDNEDIPFRAGVNLSYISEDDQNALYDYITYNDKHVSLKQSERLKELAADAALDDDALNSVFLRKTNDPRKNLRLPMRDIQGYFPDMDEDEIRKKVLEIIRLHCEAAS